MSGAPVAPSDEQLAASFGTSGEISLQEMLSQTEHLAPALNPGLVGDASSPRGRGGRGGNRGRGQRGRGGNNFSQERQGIAQEHVSPASLARKEQQVPFRSNRRAQLEKITESIANTPLPLSPPVDVATTAEIEDMSVRSSRMEEELEDVHTELAVAKGRIESLETEQSNLVSMYTNTAHELAKIKEMVLQLTRSANQTGDPNNKAPPRAASIAAPPAPGVQENRAANPDPATASGGTVSGNPPVVSGSRFKKKAIL